jgi:hypothetical protein
MQAVRDTMKPLEGELQKERASSLGRAGAALEQALAAWREAHSNSGSAAVAKAEAQKRLWYLVVQREALGLRRHRELYELYGIPKSWWY